MESPFDLNRREGLPVAISALPLERCKTTEGSASQSSLGLESANTTGARCFQECVHHAFIENTRCPLRPTTAVIPKTLMILRAQHLG